jgi:hypothetical protein
MKLFKLIALGAAAAYGYNYLTKKDVNGKSKVDQFKDNNPDWLEKGKNLVKNVVDNYSNKNNRSTY